MNVKNKINFYIKSYYSISNSNTIIEPTKASCFYIKT